MYDFTPGCVACFARPTPGYRGLLDLAFGSPCLVACLKKPLASFGERVCKACAIASETRFEGARLSLAQELLNFRPGHLDGIEVRRIGGQIKHACTRAFNPFTHPRYLMRFGVI